ncbi:thiamine phosphate synthase [Rhabdobacter roseus]|uniref:Thiamine-phosphate synthase n=1 Tax=Rhabdobacter roseus TaxID=1655419 RepID=A0A840TLU5_9BACT|nr:thiamine phosphate synthase [Rhabdobacter roseus]MBB5282747.1 thiamine-phosphate pyrophosphorylase [Rhabdobacter roseus]
MNFDIHKLHYITQGSTPQQHLDHLRRACEAGVSWVQLRLKDQPEAEVLRLAQEAQRYCQTQRVALIINDYPHVARQVGATGVHVGKTDLPVAEVRRIVGPQVVIGATANTYEDIEQHVRQGADYVGLGPYRFTTTKQNLSPILGLEGYRSILQQCQQNGLPIPIVAIGGIEVADVPALRAAGVHGVAVSSLITMAAQPAEVISELYYFLN